jgi:hypothetical protein
LENSLVATYNKILFHGTLAKMYTSNKSLKITYINDIPSQRILKCSEMKHLYVSF